MSVAVDAFTSAVTMAELLLMIIAASFVYLNYSNYWFSKETSDTILKTMLMAAVSLIAPSLASQVVKEEYRPNAPAATAIGLLAGILFVLIFYFVKKALIAVSVVFILYFVSIYYDQFVSGQWWILVFLIVVILVVSLVVSPVYTVVLGLLVTIECAALITYGSFDLHHLTTSRLPVTQTQSTFILDSFGAQTCLESDKSPCALRFVVFSFLVGIRFVLMARFWIQQTETCAKQNAGCCFMCCKTPTAEENTTKYTKLPLTLQQQKQPGAVQ